MAKIRHTKRVIILHMLVMLITIQQIKKQHTYFYCMYHQCSSNLSTNIAADYIIFITVVCMMRVKNLNYACHHNTRKREHLKLSLFFFCMFKKFREKRRKLLLRSNKLIDIWWFVWFSIIISVYKESTVIFWHAIFVYLEEKSCVADNYF